MSEPRPSIVPDDAYPLDLTKLPSSWRVTYLREISLEVQSGFASGIHNREGKGLPHLRMMNITNEGELDLTQLEYVPNVGAARIRKGEILFTNTNSVDLVGKTTLFDREGEWAFSNHMTRIRLSSDQVPDLFARQMHFLWKRGYFRQRCTRHVNQASFGREALLNTVPLIVPPAQEQREIVRILAAVRGAICATDRVIAASRVLRRSLLAARLRCESPGQGDDRRPAGIDTSIGTLPADWKVSSVGELFDIQQGKALSPKSRTGNSLHPFLRTANVLWGHLDLSSVDQMNITDEEAQRYRLMSGDLLVCEGGEIGRAALWEGGIEPCYYQNHLHRLRPRIEGVDPRFYMYWMEGALTLFGLYAGYGNITTIPNLSKGRLASLNVPFPPTAQQLRIAGDIASVDEKIRSEEAQADALLRLYDSLLQRLLTAQLRLSSQEAVADA